VGDFYNSKIVIKDLNIQFEENTWDLNPEGIGVQPMIADVTLQINFIGGQGLEKPVERLQNALSSNFYANTEMYDERSIETTTSIGGQTGNTFTVDFLNSLNKTLIPKTGLKDSNGKIVNEGVYIGIPIKNTTINGTTLSDLNYTNLVTEVYNNTKKYFDSYQDMYNNVLTTYGPLLTNLIINRDYRTIKNYTIYDGVGASSLELFGVFPNTADLPSLVKHTTDALVSYLTTKFNADNMYILDTLKLIDVVPKNNWLYVGTTLHNYIITNLPTILNDISTLQNITNFESTRNALISSLDGLNFINENGYDVNLSQNKTTKATFSGYTNGDLFNSYSDCIDYISSNTDKMFSKLDTSINYLTIALNDSLVQDIIQTLFYSYKTQMIDGLKTELSTDDLNAVTNKLNNVLYQVKKVNFKFPKAPIVKNNDLVTYSVASEIIDTTTDEIKQLFATKNNVINTTNTLNYYKP